MKTVEECQDLEVEVEEESWVAVAGRMAMSASKKGQLVSKTRTEAAASS